jgi:hypothetical protein
MNNLLDAVIAAKLGGSGGGGSGMTEDVKQALLNALSHVAWTDEHGQDYYDALEAAIYPPADIVSISAVYTQSGTVYDTDSLDNLKSDLVVTALYVDTTTATITNYTLSGTLTVGTSTITVSYGGKTTTFDVTVSAPAFLYELSESDFSRGLANGVNYNSTPPYTQVNAKRISYVDFNLLFDGGKTYEIIATSTKDTANMGIQFFNAALLDDVANHNNIGTANTLDDGWQNLSVTIAVPATHNNSAIKGCRITFRESSANPSISSDFKITKLTIREVTV